MKSILTAALLLFVCLAGCRKDKPLLVTSVACHICVECTPLPESGCNACTPWGWTYFINVHTVHRPCFSPLNPDEFLYVAGSDSLVVYELSTQTANVIFQGEYIDSLSGAKTVGLS